MNINNKSRNKLRKNTKINFQMLNQKLKNYRKPSTHQINKKSNNPFPNYTKWYPNFVQPSAYSRVKKAFVITKKSITLYVNLKRM